MSTPINNGGVAFPSDGAWGNGHPEPGMTLRDYFAAQALNGILSDQRDESYVSNLTVRELGKLAYDHADAMIAARDAGKESPWKEAP